MDKLGSFHANQISMCLDLHLNYGRGWRCETCLSPQVKYFTDRSNAVLLLWIFHVFSVLCLLCLCMHLFICALWSTAGKGLTSWPRLWCITLSLSLSILYPWSDVVLDCIDS